MWARDHLASGASNRLPDENLPPWISLLRPALGDVVCRWGGEEFIVIIDGGASEAEALGQRLLSAMRAQIFPEVGRVTISIGVALGRSGDSLSGVLERVDGALYAAKQQGRDRLVSNANER